MMLPNNLKILSRDALKHIIRLQQKAIAAECRRCLCRESLRGIKDCGGLHLEEGNCPLYDFSPFGQR